VIDKINQKILFKQQIFDFGTQFNKQTNGPRKMPSHRWIQQHGITTQLNNQRNLPPKKMTMQSMVIPQHLASWPKIVSIHQSGIPELVDLEA
jgi:hypothetical protein